LRAVLRDRLWQSLFGVLLVLAVTVFYLFSSVLDTPLLHGTRTVRVEMASTGGLFGLYRWNMAAGPGGPDPHPAAGDRRRQRQRRRVNAAVAVLL